MLCLTQPSCKPLSALIALLLSLVLSATTDAALWFVDASRPPGGDGSSWAHAFNCLHDALENPHLDVGDQIWVAAGVYEAQRESGRYARLGLNHTFVLPEEVRLFGGFSGTETALSQRNPEKNRTVLAAGPDTVNVVTALDIGGGCGCAFCTRTVLGGFIITGGEVGVTLRAAAPLIVSCRFEGYGNDGTVAISAEGVFDPDWANRGPQIIDSTFYLADALEPTAVVRASAADVVLRGCVFEHCFEALDEADVIDGEATLVECAFVASGADDEIAQDGAEVRAEEISAEEND